MKDDKWIGLMPTKPFKKYSQNGEEGYIEHILFNLGVDVGHAKGTVLDLGAGDGITYSNSKYFIEKGFVGWLVDSHPEGNEAVIKSKITRENIAATLKKIGCPKDLTFLTIDLDGNDFDIIEAILKAGYKPRLIVAEINGCIPKHVSKKIPYNPKHSWGNDDYYGFSFEAAKVLASRHGYKLIFQNDGVNAYLVRREELAEPDAELNVRFEHFQYHKHEPEKEWEVVE